jgi:EF-hand domain pair/PUB domain
VNDAVGLRRDKDKDKKDKDKEKDKGSIGSKGRKSGTAALSTTASASPSTPKTDSMYGEDPSMSVFLQGASSAQQAQVKMIGQVFADMDADKDGLLSPADVRTYFRSMGRNASDGIVKKWITSRDIDQDGAVSLVEFIASYSLQLDPSSAHKDKESDIEHGISSVTSAFGAVCLGNTPAEVVDACTAAEGYVRRILDKPTVQDYWRISVSDDEYNRRVGRLFGGTKLMLALGFEPEQNGAVIAIRDPTGRVWESLPSDVRAMLSSRLSELKCHEQAHTEPSVSNVAAGNTLYHAILHSVLPYLTPISLLVLSHPRSVFCCRTTGRHFRDDE